MYNHIMIALFATSPDGTRIAYECCGAGLAMLGWVRAMLDWPEVAPPDFRCPTLYLVGSEDQPAMQSLQEYATSIPGSLLQVQVVEGLGHDQLFDDVERIMPILSAFTHNSQAH